MSNLDSDVISDEENLAPSPFSPVSSQGGRKSKAVVCSTSHDDIDEILVDAIKSSSAQSETELWCLSLGKRLDKLPTHQKAWTRNQIENMMFQAEYANAPIQIENTMFQAEVNPNAPTQFIDPSEL